MSNIKERLLGAITVMDEEAALRLWEYVQGQYRTNWQDISEEEPDDTDLAMLRDIANDPDCAEFATDEEVKRLFA